MALDSATAGGPPSAAPYSVRRMPPGGLLADRLLTGASAFFELVQRMLETVVDRSCWAQAQLEALARPEAPVERRVDALLRYRQTVDDLRASLTATGDIGHSLVEAGLANEFGLLASLDLLPRIGACLPPVPPDAEAARDGLAALGGMMALIAQAQARFAAGQDEVRSRLAPPANEPAEADIEPGLLEDADQEKEAVRLQALQVRQQLAGYAIGLNAVRPYCLQELDED